MFPLRYSLSLSAYFVVPMGHELAVGGKAADCQPMWVRVWVRQLTRILTHTIFSIFATKKHRKPKFSMLFGAGGVTRTHDLLITNQLLYRLSYTSAFVQMQIEV